MVESVKTELSVKVVRFDTTTPLAEVIRRLDEDVNKAGSTNIVEKIQSAKTREDFAAAVTQTVKNDFLYFEDRQLHKMLQFDGIDRPAIIVYRVGNPLIAQVILQHNPLAAYNVPLHLVILEKPEGSGTVVYYHLPSSTMGLPGGNPPELEAELQLLDAKLDRLAKKITAEDTMTKLML